jgi:hypothetical protein
MFFLLDHCAQLPTFYLLCFLLDSQLDHPNCPQVLEVFEVNDTLSIVMVPIVGQELFDRVVSTGGKCTAKSMYSSVSDFFLPVILRSK